MVVVWCYTKALSSFGEKSAPLMWLTVDHPYVDTVEVICYERTTDQFAERIYFHRGPVFAKLDVESLQERLLLEKKNALRHRESFDEQKTRIAILNKAMADYIIDRLDLLEFSPLHLVVDFKQSDAEILVCSKPANLTATHHAQKNSVLVRYSMDDG